MEKLLSKEDIKIIFPKVRVSSIIFDASISSGNCPTSIDWMGEEYLFHCWEIGLRHEFQQEININSSDGFFLIKFPWRDFFFVEIPIEVIGAIFPFPTNQFWRD